MLGSLQINLEYDAMSLVDQAASAPEDRAEMAFLRTVANQNRMAQFLERIAIEFTVCQG